MRIAVAADEDTGVARAVLTQLRARGHDPVPHGALAAGERTDWAWTAESAAREVADGRADLAVVCCWTGTGASIAANKVPGVRAALCLDAQTADGARKWNDANALAQRVNHGDGHAGALVAGDRDPHRPQGSLINAN